MNPCNHAVDEFNLCVYRCEASLKELLIVNPCEKCGKLDQPHDPCDCPNDDHICAGDNCVCIGGDENHDPCDYEDDRTPFDFADDSQADADALASAGWGTDEDYGGWDSD